MNGYPFGPGGSENLDALRHTRITNKAKKSAAATRDSERKDAIVAVGE